MEKKTLINSVNILSNGIIEILLKPVLVNDSGTEFQIGLMRNAGPFVPGADLAAGLVDLNAILTAADLAAVSATDWDAQVTTIATTQWTDDVIAAYKAAVANTACIA